MLRLCLQVALVHGSLEKVCPHSSTGTASHVPDCNMQLKRVKSLPLCLSEVPSLLWYFLFLI